MKVALVHDFLKEYGGAERVLEVLHEMWPEAPVYTAFVDFNGLGPHAERIKKWDIRPSWVQNNWLVKKFHSPLRFLAPKIWESFDFSGYDLVISSASWYITKGIITPPNCVHICYLHSVPRALYGYETRMNWKKYLPTRIYGSLVNHSLRIYDFLASKRVDYFIANSKETAQRIKKFYRRECTVIYPPVEIREVQSAKIPPSLKATEGYDKNQNDNAKFNMNNSYYLSVSRLAGAKHIDLAVKTANKMGFPFYVVGKGPEERYLKSIAGQTIKFFGEVTDEELVGLYSNCKAFIFCAKDEDFGIVPVEAMGFGKAVIAYKSGGVAETVIDGKTGVFFEELTEECLEKAIRRYEKMTINGEDCRKRAEEFSKERFIQKMREFAEEKLAKQLLI